MAKKYCYLFTEGNAKMRELLGGKGANLAEMTNIGLPVPQGFTISTEACTQYYEDGRQINPEIQAEIMEYIDKMEQVCGKKFGDKENPLLVSVRSGARASMPGMMDTILNLGLNEEVVETLAAKSGNPRWAYDCYRRFIQMYSDVVMEVGKKYFEQLIDKMKEEKGVTQDVELTADDLKTLAEQFKAEYKAKIGSDFPSDPKEQLFGAIKAVFRSWDNPRANVYRMDHDIPYSWGTAVNVQMMAFGNMGDNCGTGVAFTRNPATGEKGLMGEFLTNAQGEDVVAGVRTPMPISKMADIFPDVYKQFQEVCKILENHYRDMQDMEFTVENGKLYMLQTRNGKRTAAAAIKIACDLIDEGMITEQEALMQIDAKSLDMLLHPQFDPNALKKADKENVVGKGIAASPGAAAGSIVFTAEDAVEKGKKGEKVVLVRLETSPEDIEGMKYAQGILTVRGGQTSTRPSLRAAWAPAASPAAATSRWMRRTSSSPSPARSTMKATAFRWTAPPATSTTASFRPFPQIPTAAISAVSWISPTSIRLWASVPMQTPRRMQSRLPHSVRRVSACAVPSTCSSAKAASSRSAR